MSAQNPTSLNDSDSDNNETIDLTTLPQFPTEENPNAPEEGVALCLSGGGYRAMLFHAGAMIRLNELGVLPKLSRISSVSGGSITAGILGMNWKNLEFDSAGVASNLSLELINPVQKMAETTIDRRSVLGGVFLPGSVSDWIVSGYEKVLFGDATLQSLPSDNMGPRFVFNATSVQSGVLVRMSKPYLADYRVGMIKNPTFSLAQVVAASSACPPFLSPAEIDVDPTDFESDDRCDLQEEPYTDTMILTDGGVYDNLGLETAWKRYKTILVSDGGGQMQPEPDPSSDWARHSKRILDIIDNQVRSLRKRQLIDSYRNNSRNGAYWGIRTNIKHYGLEDAIPAPLEEIMKLANTATRLKRLSQERQEKLMNWGYAVADAGMRKHCSELLRPVPSPARLPFGANGFV